MRYYFAPMEGITDSIYRARHREFFPGIDRYYTPFFSPTQSHSLTRKEQRELPPRHSLNMEVIPQILTKVPEDFLWLAEKCMQLGYEEVNLNAGCPSGTVTAKGKGAGMLASPEALDRFLEEVFSRCPIAVSVKTRIGIENADEFPRLLEVYNRYPIKELTVHPRVRKAFYEGTADMDAFTYAAGHSKNPLCYNGDITALYQADAIGTQFPSVNAVMIGRGLIARPDMLCAQKADGQTLLAFYEALLLTIYKYSAAAATPCSGSKSIGITCCPSSPTVKSWASACARPPTLPNTAPFPGKYCYLLIAILNYKL